MSNTFFHGGRKPFSYGPAPCYWLIVDKNLATCLTVGLQLMSFVIHFHTRFSLGRLRGQQTQEDSKYLNGFHINLLAPHQDGTNQGRRYNLATLSLADLRAAIPWM